MRGLTPARVVLALLACAAVVTGGVLSPFGSALAQAPNTAWVTVWNRPIVELRAVVEGAGPAYRATRAQERIDRLPFDVLTNDVHLVKARFGDLDGVLIMVGSRVVLGLVQGDVEPQSGQNLTELGQRTAERLERALRAKAEQYRPSILLRGLALSVGATLLLIGVLYAGWIVRRRLLLRLENSERTPLILLDVNFRPMLTLVWYAVIRFAFLGLAGVAVYLWLTFTLGLFPYSQPWGNNLAAFFLRVLEEFGNAAVNAAPSLFRLAVILLLAKFATGVVRVLFRGIEDGNLAVRGFDPGAVRATQRLVVIAIWIFALAFAYPYVPGSGTASFQAISVLVGVVASLAGGAFVAQMLSGLVILYSQSLKPGEYVRIGNDVKGVVKRMGVWAVKISDSQRGEITIPNKILLENSVINNSRTAAGRGHMVATSVTIGYGVPWRQIHALLLRAAERTAGVLKEPRPTVSQRVLSDFYVDYELVAYIDQPHRYVATLSELHAEIQDAFNEFGVQIMSPHFVYQPASNVVVPKEQWHVPPAEDQADTPTNAANTPAGAAVSRD